MHFGEVDNAELVADILGCILDSLPSSYVGLGVKFEKKSIWELVIKRFEKRLWFWKTKYLAKGMFGLQKRAEDLNH